MEQTQDGTEHAKHALTIAEFLEARIAEDEKSAAALLKDLEGEVAESYADAVDERGPFTPQRLLSAKMWAQFAGQSKWRNFAEGQNIATLANPASVLAECAAKRAIIEFGRDAAMAAEVDRRDASALGAQLMHSDVLRALAAVYADHPDYRQEWAL